ncbi:monocarboxylate transporter 14-like [Mytilus californianus]|uniref:monocarboxylate transporter 14-like n=1 Tax=Mytilus californianus TaxID=6549 RepID=UPI0022470C59|nr:monocarboxylate transporter 14-like [Mytilus californianus]
MGLYSWLEKKEGGFWGVVVVFSAFMIQIPSFGTAQSFGIYNMFFLRYFDDSPAAISLIGSINVGVFLGSGPIATILMNHMSHRKVALIGATLSCIGLIGLPFAPNIIYMYGFYGVLSGLGFCLVYVPSHVLSGLYYDTKRSLATGLATSGSGVGAIIFPIMVNFLVDKYGWRGSFYIVCGISMQNFIFASLLRPVPESLKQKYEKAAQDREIEVEGLDTEPEKTESEIHIKDSEKLYMKTTSVKLLSYARKMSLEDEIKEEDKNSEVKSNINKNEGVALENVQLQEKSPETNIKILEDEAKEVQDGTHTEIVIPGSPTRLLKEETKGSMEIDTCKKCDTPRNSLNEVEELAMTKKSTCSILFNYAFIIFFANNILWNMGVVIILLFGPQYFLTIGLTEQSSASIFSIGGFGAFFGSILGGIVGNIPKLRLDIAYIVITVLTGSFCLLFPITAFHSFGGLTIIYVAFSVMANIIMGLLVVAVAAIVGPDALGTGMGYVMLANGIGSIAAPPLIGWVFEQTGSIEIAFYIGGGCIILAGLLIILIPVLDYFYLEPKPSRRKPEKIAKECLHVYCM